MVTVPDTIVCVECQGTCHRLGHPPEEGYNPGDVVAYRCAECQDRWDVVVADPDQDPEPEHVWWQRE